ncbi:Uncharacterised protein [Janthinobacterium lividum]|nr:Uncharacterised protein [Janthinobacterium lividum]
MAGGLKWAARTAFFDLGEVASAPVWCAYAAKWSGSESKHFQKERFSSKFSGFHIEYHEI